MRRSGLQNIADSGGFSENVEQIYLTHRSLGEKLCSQKSSRNPNFVLIDHQEEKLESVGISAKVSSMHLVYGSNYTGRVYARLDGLF